MTETREIERDSWQEYFDALSRELVDSPVSIEISSPERRPATQASHMALHTLTYDRREDVFEVAVAQGGPHLPDVLRHMVDHPSHIRVDSVTLLAPMSISVEAPDGTTTLIRVQRAPDISS